MGAGAHQTGSQVELTPEQIKEREERKIAYEKQQRKNHLILGGIAAFFIFVFIIIIVIAICISSIGRK
jgi:ABC-type Na+ efflux pump permease subunit